MAALIAICRKNQHGWLSPWKRSAQKTFCLPQLLPEFKLWQLLFFQSEVALWRLVMPKQNLFQGCGVKRQVNKVGWSQEGKGSSGAPAGRPGCPDRSYECTLVWCSNKQPATHWTRWWAALLGIRRKRGEGSSRFRAPGRVASQTFFTMFYCQLKQPTWLRFRLIPPMRVYSETGASGFNGLYVQLSGHRMALKIIFNIFCFALFTCALVLLQFIFLFQKKWCSLM